MKITDIVGKFARDCAIATIALVAAKASEVGAKAAWKKAVELKKDFDKNGLRPLNSYKGILNESDNDKNNNR